MIDIFLPFEHFFVTESFSFGIIFVLLVQNNRLIGEMLLSSKILFKLNFILFSGTNLNKTLVKLDKRANASHIASDLNFVFLEVFFQDKIYIKERIRVVSIL